MFLAFKKIVQVVQIGGRGGGGGGGWREEVIWTKSKRTATCFRETFPYHFLHTDVKKELAALCKRRSTLLTT